jgi:hypothetical protein
VVCDEVVAADKEATAKRAAEEAVAKRAMEEAVVKKATEERAVEEATVKAAAVEAAGVAGASPAPSQVPPAAEAKRPVALSGSTPPAKRPYRGVWKPRFVQLSPPLFFLTTFLSRSASSGAATVTGAAAADAVVGAALGPAPDCEPRTPEGVPEDVVESEGEPEAVTAVVQEEAPAERATFISAPQSHDLGGCRQRGNGGGLGTPPFTRQVTSL